MQCNQLAKITSDIQFVCMSCMQFLSVSKVMYCKNRISEICYSFYKSNAALFLVDDHHVVLAK
ncbi:hypothetical protein T4D_1377 [Trichinella pseudospiralis]|uniref:Uncharacterized protein n=1 Tax=Trichinella pseudospiralis TaxID=6337 RepID=A0A0V1FHJ8_TRIPS|nr:hypothetical protein T4D_1377 [Trichinella pseudospiralis]